MDPRAMFVIDQATRLIAAGGAYKEAKLEDAVHAVLDELNAIPVIIDHPQECDGCPVCADRVVISGTMQ